jgi:hypothetical protein
MKKIFLVAGILITATTMTFAQNSNDAKQVKAEDIETKKELRHERRMENKTEVSDRTKDAFVRDFPDAKNSRFVKTERFDKVFFLNGKKNEVAYYDYSNHLAGTTQEKSFSDLPESAQKNILKKYKEYNISRVIKFDGQEDNDTDMYLYGISFDDADNYFVELKNADKAIVVKVDLSGEVSFFSDMH